MTIDPDGRPSPPIACTLGNDDREDRVQQWRELAAAAGAEPVIEPGRLTSIWVLPPDGHRTLEKLVDSERHCCGFADFRLIVDGASATLVITGPIGTEQFFSNIFD